MLNALRVASKCLSNLSVCLISLARCKIHIQVGSVSASTDKHTETGNTICTRVHCLVVVVITTSFGSYPIGTRIGARMRERNPGNKVHFTVGESTHTQTENHQTIGR